MIANSPFELWRLLEQEGLKGGEQLNALAAMADAPPEDFQVSLRLPVQNKLPGFKIGDGSLGSKIAGLEYGVVGPVLEQDTSGELSIGALLIGEDNG